MLILSISILRQIALLVSINCNYFYSHHSIYNRCFKTLNENTEYKLNTTVVLHEVKEGQNVVGYEMELIDNRQPMKKTYDSKVIPRDIEFSDEFEESMTLWED